ncbi:hypothetical protein [Actinoplanes friuliensis]|uniref:Antitoxin Xre/MbcA/ParS-like toxin-binding domain-containing protein n=1 Tax=Actinoplanes friuliensis DSM 7358 TaxID=1246995 RepID=U5W9Q5_9ACTN|nr:hypothetical protein [Actinoplanes friuliensis]AGZ45938.1 hypothetical protein AFR_38420 [Actinoplanes friuliensis DSM 7358]
MTAAILDRAEFLSPVDDQADLCVTALGRQLTAYVAGAGSVEEFESWFAGRARPDRRVAGRLSAAAEVISVFEAANRTTLAAAWLREMDPSGYVPARVLRLSEGDPTTAKALIETAIAWVQEADLS